VHEGIDRCDFDRVVLRPQTSVAAKGRNAALSRDAGTGQRKPVASSREQLRRSLDTHVSAG
jgi:hypothetical protein